MLLVLRSSGLAFDFVSEYGINAASLVMFSSIPIPEATPA